ncbi:MAG: S8 family serine peptidase [Nitrosopumilus sp.]|nr:S8 family serine peptidase [Nitrosopumilus sp.]MDH3385245.1 S8 family serine peptidase [Nitrosopumilus sp.]
MPTVAIFFMLILLSYTISSSYGFTGGDVVDDNFVQKNYDTFFDSNIVDIAPDFFTKNNFKRYVIFGTGVNDFDFLQKNSMYGIESEQGFFHVAVLDENSVSKLISRGYNVIEDFPLDFHSEKDIPDASVIGKITGANLAEINYNVTGKGITIAIVDTGVDFSNPDIQDSVARDKSNHPIMIDVDGQGIVLTNATFFAFKDKDNIIRNYSKPIPEGITSGVYQSKEGIFLDIVQDGKGTNIPIYNSFFPQAGFDIIFNGTLNTDIKIGNNNRDYIKSKSGIYHLGIMFQGGLSGPESRVQVVPVLFVDSNIAGNYDTIIPDLSTSWEDFTRYDLESNETPNYDFDFTDEKPIILGSGNEFLVYDSNGDGKIDYSAGAVGAKVLDVYGVIQDKKSKVEDTVNAINGTLLSSIDPDGEYFGVMTDFMGHGTSSTGSITSRGVQEYDIYNNTKKFIIKGVAPDAKIVPIKALWFGDTVYAWLWAAGFENEENNWKFTGKTNVDIISNSWGISNFPILKSSPGMDILSLIASILATPKSLDDDYPGITIVSSAGNSGPGYGTMGMPNVSPFGISVGATTNNVFVGYGPFKNEPRFGNSTLHNNDVVDFSSRGPGIIGDPKPDIMSIGAYGFTPSNMLKIHKDSKKESFSLFGGTSMAAPIVSGSAAILMEGLQNQSKDYDPFTIKNILMSTATDLQNDPFNQGSGLVNVNSALQFVNGDNETFIVYNDASYTNIKKILDPAVESINSTALDFERFKIPSRSMPMTSWFAGHLSPGEKSYAKFTIENPGNTQIDIKIKPQKLSLIKKNQFDGTTKLQQLDTNYLKDPELKDKNAYIPNYIKLSDVKLHQGLGEFFDEKNTIPEDASLLVLNVNFPFNSFMNKTDDIYANDLKISSLYLYDWNDLNNNTKVTSNELSLINRAGSWGTVQELRVTDPNEQFEGIPLVGVYPIPTRYSFWSGDTRQNSTAMDYTLSASYYKKQNWSVMWPESSTITVPPQDTADVKLNLILPTDIQPGVYQGFLTFESVKHTVNAPVSFVVKQSVNQKDTPILIKGYQSEDVLYGNGYVKGAFDMANRYMAGDWRQYYFDIQDEFINSAAIELSWLTDDTNLSVFVMNPEGKIIQTNMPPGIFGHFMGWVSLDWLGNSMFSQGGGFFPVKNKDNTSTVIYVPINQTGTYSILAHSTLFGGNSTTEPITLAAKFSTISADVQSEINELNQTKIQLEPIPLNKTQTKPEVKDDSNDSSNIIKQDEILEVSFPLELIVGIGIGIAIALVFVFVTRRNSDN